MMRDASPYYSAEVAEEICSRLANGESLRTICSEKRMPTRGAVRKWLIANEDFRRQYAQAREEQAHTLAEECLAIADDGSQDYYITEDGRRVVNYEVTARSKLRFDARRWYASHLHPKVYGDKMNVDANVNVTDNRSIDEIKANAIALAAKLGVGGKGGVEEV